ncbi:hypothetical protein CVN68_11910 [Sphingomonas psychrotolerans]|uniref:Uncharacterized protein n=1 Tax=Sphingomonas psychrotolerans TaxID=1327635 RepID=A0A2K8MFC1_9SPHN|nr:hypothetical protein CVN68_11910 [Sphingomonas psychrotolerans]
MDGCARGTAFRSDENGGTEPVLRTLDPASGAGSPRSFFGLSPKEGSHCRAERRGLIEHDEVREIANPGISGVRKRSILTAKNTSARSWRGYWSFHA